MNILYGVLLFFIMTPGILFHMPFKNRYVVTAIHAVIFALLYYLLKEYIDRKEDNFSDGMTNLVAFIIFIGLISCIFSGGNCVLVSLLAIVASR